MKFLAQLLDRAVAAIPPDLHDRVVVFGSAPMVFAGLKPDVTFDLEPSPQGPELRYSFSWGQVWSTFDARGLSSPIGVRFRREALLPV